MPAAPLHGDTLRLLRYVQSSREPAALELERVFLPQSRNAAVCGGAVFHDSQGHPDAEQAEQAAGECDNIRRVRNNRRDLHYKNDIF